MKKYIVNLLCVGALTLGATNTLLTQNMKVSAASVEQTAKETSFEKVSGTLEVMVFNENIFTDKDLSVKTSRVLPFLSQWRVFGVQKVNGKESAYNLGGNQWISAENVIFHEEDGATVNAVKPMKGVFVVKVPGRPTWATVVWRENLSTTNKYLKPNTAWKVFGKKTIKGNLYYNLGGDQWVCGKYGFLR